jgi:AraC family transcriptional regulator
LNTSVAEYNARLNHVLDYIHANLDQVLTLEILSNVAGFSPFHFHRLFKNLAGETLSDYVWRARLEKSANLLAYHPEDSILMISQACGFSSPAVFSRAFKARFGVSPSEYRKQRIVERNQGKDFSISGTYNGKHAIHFDLERRNFPMNVEVKILPSYHVAYIRHITGYSKGQFSGEIDRAFQRVCAWAAARDLFGPTTLVIGIPYDNPDITPNDRCRYDACVTIPAEVNQGTGEVGIEDISGGKYAVGHIEVSTKETHKIGEMVNLMYGEWLPSSGYTVEDKPALEIYGENPDKPRGTWISMDYCIPVKPL